MAEYCARLGVGDPEFLHPEVMRSRWDRLRDGMPKFPEPGEAYCSALRALAFEPNDAAVTRASRLKVVRQRPSYPPRSKISSVVAAARAAGVDVAGIRVWPDGSVAVFDPRCSGNDRQFTDGLSTVKRRDLEF